MAGAKRRRATKVVALDGELTIARAAETAALLRTSLEEARSLELDLSGVAELDSAGVQLLLSAKRSAEATKRGFCVRAASPAVTEVLALLGVRGLVEAAR